MTMHRALRTSQLSAALRRSWTSATSVALAVLFGACSSGDVDPAPSFSGGQTSPGSGGSGSVNAPSVSPGSTSNNSPSTNTNTPSTSQQTASNANNSESLPTNLPQTNGTAGSGSNSNNNNTNSGTQGSGGAGNNTASAGSAGSASTNGAAGGGTMPPAGAAGTSGMGSAGAGGTTQQPPVSNTPDIPCPDGAIFCSGFEGTTFPVGTVNITGGPPISNGFQLDTTEFHSGRQSFFLPLTAQSFSYRVMWIPVPQQQFWARVYARFDTLFGDIDHDAIFAVSDSDQTVDNNNEIRVEFAEQENTICFNRSVDKVTFPVNRPQTLSENTWHCLETRFDGDKGDMEVFADGGTDPIVSSLGNSDYKFKVKSFRIGTLQFHSPRNVWFDDVIISSNRVGCN